MSTELTVIPPSEGEIDRLVKHWWTCWLGMHWGFRKHAVVYWVCTGTISPVEAFQVLGIPTPNPLDIVIFHRELAVQQIPEYDLAREIIRMTPIPERKELSRFFAGHNVFECGEGSTRTIAQLIDDVTVPAGFPKIRLTDDGIASRIPSARMVFDGLRRTFNMRGETPQREPGVTPLIFISAECPELISALPTLISDPKRPEDSMSVGTLQDEVWEACKNSYRDYLSVRAQAPLEVRRRQAIELASTPTGKYMNLLKFDHENGQGERRVRRR